MVIAFLLSLPPPLPPSLLPSPSLPLLSKQNISPSGHSDSESFWPSLCTTHSVYNEQGSFKNQVLMSI